MAEVNESPGPNRGRNLSRREFVGTVVGTSVLAKSPLVFGDSMDPAGSSSAETPATRFFQTLDDAQRKQICFPFEHPLRTRVENNWAVVKPKIADLTAEQQTLCRAIFKGLCSDEGHERFLRQMNEDHGGYANYHVALFGEPGTREPFEWVLTGRHTTLRADGNRHQGVAFGGPLFYGHGAESRPRQALAPTGNVWAYQAELASAILRSLDTSQRVQACWATSRGIGSEAPGLAVAELDAAQKALVQQLLHGLIRPFRGFDAEAIQECLREVSGADRLRLTFFKAGNQAWDRDWAWDAWKLEGPRFTWSFHGTPHVHSWVKLIA